MQREITDQRRPGDKDGAAYRPRVVVKFYDYVSLPYGEDVEEEVERRQVGRWSDLSERFPGIRLVPLHQALSADEISGMVDRASASDRTYKPPNFLTYFAIDCPPAVDADALASSLQQWRSVQEAYVEGGPTIPPQVNAVDDPRQVNQGYENAAPDGIDAEFAWTIAGGDGVGIEFVDLEQGWTLNHEDLNAAGITIISGISNAYAGHGTSVLGEIVAVDNTRGDVGIATRAGARVVSQWRTASTYNTAEAILSAAAALSFGDVLLLEAQTTATGWSYLPVEIETAVYDAIRLATALGVVVVEAAGNGSTDLDTYTTPAGLQILNRASADFRDSGAIMVGATSSATPHTVMSFSNLGSRIDCFGWGENVDTTGDGWTGTSTTTYTATFSGTSSASPIVAGAALSVQGMAESAQGYRFSPRALREILSDPANGTTSATPATDRIGVMPNLRTIAHALTFVEDVYVRDFVGDSGDPHAGAISASPDIIARPTQVPDPQASFGEGSGTENDATLGFEVEAGQDNYIYVRAQNRGGAPAANVDATVYWAPVATLVTPNLWTLVDTVTFPTVPMGDQLTVSDAIVWPSGAIPATGHYCFVGLIGTTLDPAPGLVDLLNWSNFTNFIRSNNNVTWRNFNVVNNVPPAGSKPPGFVELVFLAPGAPDRARPFALEILARLPEGARLLLEAPLHLLERLEEIRPDVEMDEDRGYGSIPVNPHGRFALPEVLFPAESQARLRLLVDIPKELRKNAYEVAVRQLYRRQEVGRVTWRLAPRRRGEEKNKGRRAAARR